MGEGRFKVETESRSGTGSSDRVLVLKWHVSITWQYSSGAVLISALLQRRFLFIRSSTAFKRNWPWAANMGRYARVVQVLASAFQMTDGLCGFDDIFPSS